MKVVRLFPTIFSLEDNESLDASVSLDELKATLSSCQKSKILGSDGWTVEFYEFFFHLVGPDLKEVVKEVRTKGIV